MVVAGEIEVHLVLFEERLPVGDEIRAVAVRAVGIKRVVPHDDEPGSGARPGDLRFEPGVLLGFLGFSQRDDTGFVVAVEHDEFDERFLLGEIKGIPLRGHGPAGAGMIFRIGEFGGELVLGLVIVVVITEHGVAGTGENVSGIHVLELSLPTGAGGAAIKRAVKVVTEQQHGVGFDSGFLNVAFHAPGNRFLRFHFFFHRAPVAEH